MVMLHFLHSSGYMVEVAHCNFKLRGKESDGDEKFLSDWCRRSKIPFHVRSFDTLTFAKEKGLSIQMAARELRYAWFKTLAKERNIKQVCIASTADDNVETFFINLFRSSGIKGLKGIKEHDGIFVRPMLSVFRSEVLKYAEKNKIKWREDSSNLKADYLRNNLRLNLIPHIEKSNPSLKNEVTKTMSFLKEAYDVYCIQIEEWKKECVSTSMERSKVDLEKVRTKLSAPTLLFEILSPFGFGKEEVNAILSLSKTQSGKAFLSDTHEALLNRNELLIQPIAPKAIKSVFIEEKKKSIKSPLHLVLKVINPSEIDYRKLASNQVLLDMAHLTFPLELRTWKEGDKFSPLGLNGMKKVSDFLIDKKISIFEKRETFVLLSENKICWLVGNRLDNRFKVNKNTQKALLIEWKKS